MPAKNSAKSTVKGETDQRPLTMEPASKGGYYRNLQDLRTTLIVAESTRKSMKANSSKDTKPELALRKALWAAGVRGYRANYAKLPGKPDIYFPKSKICVFVHGCFWHGCPICDRNLKPALNGEYWSEKVARNQARDAAVSLELKQKGFRVEIVWECELKSSLTELVKRLVSLQSEAPTN